LADFVRDLSNWLKTGRMLWYISGNISHDTAIQIVDQARSILNIKSVPKAELNAINAIQLSETHSLRLDLPVVDHSNENSGIVSYF